MAPSSFSNRARGAERSELAALFASAERPDVISFAGGFPDPDWFLSESREVSERIVSLGLAAIRTYPGPDPLREFMAERCSKQCMKTQPGEVLITSGAL